jgi:RNA polymerase sigma-70 factor (ECF subfamily)
LNRIRLFSVFGDSFFRLSVILFKRVREKEFLQIFREHHGALFRFAYRLTGSAADAEDVVQECFLELLRPECLYDAKRAPVRTYLFGVARNQALKRAPRGSSEVEGSHASTPERELLRAQVGDLVSAAVARLPEMQREVLILAHYEQMALADIAEVVGADLGAVKSRLQRAREGLREMLADYAPELSNKRGEGR